MTVIGRPCQTVWSHVMTVYTLSATTMLLSSTPALNHAEHLPSPVRQCRVSVTAFFVVSL